MGNSARLWKQKHHSFCLAYQTISNKTFTRLIRTSILILLILLTTFQLLLATPTKGQVRHLSFNQVNRNILIKEKTIEFEVRGRVVDINHKGLEFVKVSLQRANEEQIIHTVQTDTSGYFKFLVMEKGEHLLNISALGMDSLSLRFSLLDSPIVQLPEIILAAKAKQLQQVTITSKKPLIERKIDRMIFNVESSIAAKGTDVTQALALTPMLRVSSDGISIIGKSNVAVMINEKMVNISGADLINYLRSLRSDDIEKIEVITTPPAKYEAQGNSGLINIVLKRNQNIGWSGSISSTYAQTTYPAYSGSLSLNYQSKRFSSSFKLRQYHTATKPTEEIDIIGTNSILNRDTRKDIVYGFGTNLSLDYKLNEQSNIGLIYDIGKLNYHMDIKSISTYKTGDITDSLLTTSTVQKNPALTQTFSLYHDLKIGKLGKRLNSGFNFFSTLPESNVDFNTKSDQNQYSYLVRNNSNLNFKIWSLQSDLTLPYTWILVETGLKFTNFNNDSEVGYYNFNNQEYQIDLSKSNIFDYNEKNIATYLSLQKDLGKRWSVKAGLRYEYSTINGYSPASNEYNNSEYGNLFPSVYITYKPNANHTIGFNYSKRINRPNFKALNPFRWYSNPYNYSTGNPLLQPSFNHNFEFSYLYKGKLFFTLYHHKLVNGYGRLNFVSNDLLKVVNYRNYLTQYSSGFEASISHNFFPWWENREFTSLNFTNSKSSIPELLLKDGSAFYYSTYNTFTLNKSISVFLNFWHSLSSTQGNTYSNGRSYLSSGFRIALDNNRFQINASADDIFKGTIVSGETYYQQFTQTFNNYYDARRFSVSLSYSFGKDKVKGNRKQVNFKEAQRAN